MKNTHVFVYGTLLSKGANPASNMVGAEVVTGGQIPGSIYDLGWYPGYKLSTITDDTPSIVKGELIRVTEEDMDRLDSYEGVPDLYRRAQTTVETDNGEFVPAYVYVYNGNVHNDDLVLDGDWIKHLKGVD